jgi:protein-S-isoprenylcysteine O-methyltransferase Ste14
MTLQSRLALRFLAVLPLLAAILFLPAGSLRFWQAWLFMILFYGTSLYLAFYFLRRDPRLLERRLQTREKAAEQRLFKILWIPLWIGALAVPGLDYRFGWSNRSLGGVPLWLTLLAQALVLCAYILVFQVLKFNSFAAATIQVESGQRVISDGPYRIVRHPMYSGIVLLVVSAPLALGSYFALPVSLLLIPVLVYRLVNEEKMLRQELAGYAEYCRRTRYRLVPYLY